MHETKRWQMFEEETKELLSFPSYAAPLDAAQSFCHYETDSLFFFRASSGRCVSKHALNGKGHRVCILEEIFSSLRYDLRISEPFSECEKVGAMAIFSFPSCSFVPHDQSNGEKEKKMHEALFLSLSLAQPPHDSEIGSGKEERMLLLLLLLLVRAIPF